MSAFRQTIRTAVVASAFLSTFAPCWATSAQQLTDEQLAGVRFDQKLNAQVSMDLPFIDETGKQVNLGEFFRNKPVVLVLGYYECPMLCTLVLNGMIEGLQEISWTMGSEFEVVNVTINPRESPRLAAAKKAVYLKRYGRKGAGAGWHFLTGDPASIQRITGEVGFGFQYDPKSGQYAHPSGLVFLTPEGRVSGYQFGVAFRGPQLLASLKQARSGKAGSPIEKLVLLCFHYSPITGKYGPAIMVTIRILALVTILALVWSVSGLMRRRPASPMPGEGQKESVPGGAPP